MSEFIHSGEEKKKFVKDMFEDISYRYDLLNHLLSFGLDYYWRKKLVQYCEITDNQQILDVATGTGDVIFEILKKYNVNAFGLDYAYNMVNIANKKSKKLGYSNYTNFIQRRC